MVKSSQAHPRLLAERRSLTAWHALPVAEAMERLSTDPTSGLDPAEAERRLLELGPNVLPQSPSVSGATILIRQFTSLLTVLLIVAATASGLVLGQWIDAVAIFTIVLLNALIGFVRERRAADSLEALRALIVTTARVLRGGEVRELPGRDIVPGDLFLLHAGDRVPADGRLVDAWAFETDEAMLTGESLPVAKNVESVSAGALLADRKCLVFAGTTVARGSGRAVVVATGPATETGRLARTSQGAEPPTPLQLELDRVGRRLAVVALVAGAAIVGLGVGQGLRLETMILTGVALAVAVIPEGLPTVVAVSLARGMERMARRKALVRRLAAVETLGSASVICTDKTGTLTRNELAVREVVLFDPSPCVYEADDVDAIPGVQREALWDVLIACNDAYPTRHGFGGDAIDAALLRFVAGGGVDIDARRRAIRRVAEVPFDSSRKRMDVLISDGGALRQVSKGAPEVLVAVSTTLLGDHDLVPMGRNGEVILGVAEDMAARGLRTMALARDQEAADRGTLVEGGLEFVALVGLADELRPEVRASVDEAHRAGIDIVMVTGDHQVTALTIGRAAGIIDHPDQVMPGRRLAEIDQATLDREIERYRGFARVDPLDKTKIVRAWQRRGHVVAMTGDGVNDGPALRSADIGVAVGSGTDVARSASDMVLEDDNFSTMVRAVREGRRIFLNLRRVVHYLLSANASEIIVMVTGMALFGGVGPPLRAAQLLWINLVSDGMPALALGLAESSEDVMAHRPGAGRNMLGGRVPAVLLMQGLALAAAALLAAAFGEYVLGAPWQVTQTMIFTTVVVSQLLHALNLVPGSMLGALTGAVGRAVAASLLIHAAVLYLPMTQTAFDIVPLDVGAWSWSLVAAILGALAARSVRGRLAVH